MSSVGVGSAHGLEAAPQPKTVTDYAKLVRLTDKVLEATLSVLDLTGEDDIEIFANIPENVVAESLRGAPEKVARCPRPSGFALAG